MGDEFGQHRVVEGADLRPGLDAGLHPDPGSGVELEALDAAHARQVAAGRVLGVQPDLDRVARPGDLPLGERQGLAGSDTHLPLDEVEAGDLLGHRMLDLQARVHLQEEELLRRALAGDHELDGPGPHVVDRPRGGHRCGVHPLQRGLRRSG